MSEVGQIRDAMGTAREALGDPDGVSGAVVPIACTVLVCGAIGDLGSALLDKLEQVRWLLDNMPRSGR